MKKSFSVIVKDNDGEQIALNLFNTTSVDLAKRIALNLFKSYPSASYFHLYDLSVMDGDVSEGKLIYTNNG